MVRCKQLLAGPALIFPFAGLKHLPEQSLQLLWTKNSKAKSKSAVIFYSARLAVAGKHHSSPRQNGQLKLHRPRPDTQRTLRGLARLRHSVKAISHLVGRDLELAHDVGHCASQICALSRRQRGLMLLPPPRAPLGLNRVRRRRPLRTLRLQLWTAPAAEASAHTSCSRAKRIGTMHIYSIT